MRPALSQHADDGAGNPAPVLVWRFAVPMLAISSGVLGGGITRCHWVINAHVAKNYDRSDPEQHLREIAAGLDLAGDGVGLMTAARVERMTSADDDEVHCDATVGLSYPTWAAAPDSTGIPSARWRPGTVNLVCTLPVRLSPSALVNAVITATEAKTQALIEAGMPGTGTASDAIAVACATDGPAEPYGGPRSVWGARLARAVHAAVAAGAAGYLRGVAGSPIG